MTRDATRERGTLQSTLPKSPRIILTISVLVCSVLTTLLLQHSKAEHKKEHLFLSALLACLGSTANVIVSIYPDPQIYGIFFIGSVSAIQPTN